jgi:hypothetical protein
LYVSPRPLVFVSGLTFVDYLLWSWSLNHNHDVLALVSGLTLPPLAVAWIWLLALSAARLVARFARRPGVRMAGGRSDEARRRAQQRAGASADQARSREAAGRRAADAPSGKLAA